MAGAIRLSVMVLGDRGRVEVFGPREGFRGRMSRAESQLRVGDQIALQLTGRTDGRRFAVDDRVALLGTITDAPTACLATTSGTSFTIAVHTLVKNGCSVDPKAFFERRAETLPPAQASALTSSASVGDLEGRLEALALPELLVALSACRRTASIEVWNDSGPAGVVFLENGHPVHARTSFNDGAAALRTLSGIQTGRFRVVMNARADLRSLIADQPAVTPADEAPPWVDDESAERTRTRANADAEATVRVGPLHSHLLVG